MNDKQDDRHTWHDDTPFPRRWRGYMALKILVVLLAAAVALHLFGVI